MNAVLKYDYKIKVTNHLGRVNAKADTISLFNSLIFPKDQAKLFTYQSPGMTRPPSAIRQRWGLVEDKERKMFFFFKDSRRWCASRMEDG